MSKNHIFVPTAIVINKLLVRSRQAVDSGINLFVLKSDTLFLVLNQELEIGIKENIDQGTAEAAGFNFGIPVGFYCVV